MQKKFVTEDVPDGATRFLVSQGELDAAVADHLRAQVDTALAAGKQHVILDLSATTYIQTAVVAALLDANARAHRFGARLGVVVQPDSRVHAVFAVSRLNRVLRISPSREDALSAPGEDTG